MNNEFEDSLCVEGSDRDLFLIRLDPDITGNQRKTNILLMTTGLRGDQAYNTAIRYLILHKMKEGWLDCSYPAH